uniref:Uncharacterized protein n=1 Tax=Anopheles atroparvus TaxID=41427 RepID=A0AAG5D5Y1_ANOAO
MLAPSSTCPLRSWWRRWSLGVQTVVSTTRDVLLHVLRVLRFLRVRRVLRILRILRIHRVVDRVATAERTVETSGSTTKGHGWKVRTGLFHSFPIDRFHPVRNHFRTDRFRSYPQWNHCCCCWNRFRNRFALTMVEAVARWDESLQIVRL